MKKFLAMMLMLMMACSLATAEVASPVASPIASPVASPVASPIAEATGDPTVLPLIAQMLTGEQLVYVAASEETVELNSLLANFAEGAAYTDFTVLDTNEDGVLDVVLLVKANDAACGYVILTQGESTVEAVACTEHELLDNNADVIVWVPMTEENFAAYLTIAE